MIEKPTNSEIGCSCLFWFYLIGIILTWIYFPVNVWGNQPPRNNGDWLMGNILEVIFSILWPFTWLCHWANQPI